MGPKSLEPQTYTERCGARIGDFRYKGANIDRHKCSRKRPMGILCLGRERTGTASIREALFELGYGHVYHYASVLHENPRDSEMWKEAFDAKFKGHGSFGKDQWDQLLGHCGAVTDVPCCLFGPELMDTYPEAKIVLSVRDSSVAWKKSILATMWRAYEFRGPQTEPTDSMLEKVWRHLLPRSPTEPMDEEYWKALGYNHDPDGLEGIYEAHNATMIQEANKRGRGVLVFNVKQGWKPLCEFLQVKAPDHPFPRLNNESMFQRDLDLFKKIAIGIAIFKGLLYVGAIAAPIAGIWYARERAWL